MLQAIKAEQYSPTTNKAIRIPDLVTELVNRRI